jgi:flagellar biosynthetic protein FliO
MKTQTFVLVLFFSCTVLFGQTTVAPEAKSLAVAGPEVAAPQESTLSINGGDTAPAVKAPAGGAATNPNNAATPTGDITIWDYLRMFFLLILVIGMILAVVWFLRRISGQGPLVESPIKVLHNHALAGNKALLLVEVGNEILLLGTADGGVNLIKQVTDTETVDALRLAASEKKSVPLQGTFAGIIGTMLGQREKIRPKIDEPVENSTEFIKKQRERLKNL